jgi:hypothetical protein
MATQIGQPEEGLAVDQRPEIAADQHIGRGFAGFRIALEPQGMVGAGGGGILGSGGKGQALVAPGAGCGEIIGQKGRVIDA